MRGKLVRCAYTGRIHVLSSRTSHYITLKRDVASYDNMKLEVQLLRRITELLVNTLGFYSLLSLQDIYLQQVHCRLRSLELLAVFL